MRPEQGLCEAAGLKEGEAQEHRVPHAPPDGAGNVVIAQGDALHQHRVDAHADHNEERLEAQGQQGAEIVLPRVAPFPVHHRGKRDGPDRGHQIHLYTSSAHDLLRAVTALYDRIVDRNLLIRRLSISANKLLDEASVRKEQPTEQMDLFTDYAAKEQQEQADAAAHTRERKIQEAMLGIKKKYGKNAILKGMNLEDGATARERNQTIGGHHA